MSKIEISVAPVPGDDFIDGMPVRRAAMIDPLDDEVAQRLATLPRRPSAS